MTVILSVLVCPTQSVAVMVIVLSPGESEIEGTSQEVVPDAVPADDESDETPEPASDEEPPKVTVDEVVS